MIKTLVIGDLHFHDWSEKKLYRFQFEFMDYLLAFVKEKPIDILIFLGDIFHHKSLVEKNLAFKTYKWFEELSELVPIYIVTGNHDREANNPLKAKSIEPSIKSLERERIKVISEPEVILFNGINLGFLPYPFWSESDIEKVSSASFVFSHIELKGVRYPSGHVSKQGFDIKEKVNFFLFNGHYHNSTFVGTNILLVGSIMPIRMDEVGTHKSFIYVELTKTKTKNLNTIPTHAPRIVLVPSVDDKIEMEKKDNKNIYVVDYVKTREVSSIPEMSSAPSININTVEMAKQLIKEYAEKENLDPDLGLEILEEAING